MKNQMHQIMVNICVAVVSGQVAVIGGYCFDGPDDGMRLGDTFTRLIEIEVVKESTGELRRVEKHVRAVNLKVRRIVFFGHNLDSLSPGMMALIELEGEGTELVREPNCLVCFRDDGSAGSGR